MRGLISVVVGSAVVLATCTSQAAGAALSLPGPCSLAPPKLVAAALGAPKPALHPVETRASSDGLPTRTCSFTYHSKTAHVMLAPAAYGSGGYGGPGHFSHPAGLGTKGVFGEDTGRFWYADASFVKGAYWGSTWSNAHVPAATVLAWGRYVYSHL
jgi:hypothetical protein